MEYIVQIFDEVCHLGQDHLISGGIQYYLITATSWRAGGDPYKEIAEKLGAEQPYPKEAPERLLFPASLFQEMLDFHDQVMGWRYFVGNFELRVEKKPKHGIMAIIHPAEIFKSPEELKQEYEETLGTPPPDWLRYRS